MKHLCYVCSHLFNVSLPSLFVVNLSWYQSLGKSLVWGSLCIIYGVACMVFLIPSPPLLFESPGGFWNPQPQHYGGRSSWMEVDHRRGLWNLQPEHLSTSSPLCCPFATGATFTLVHSTTVHCWAFKLVIVSLKRISHSVVGCLKRDHVLPLWNFLCMLNLFSVLFWVLQRFDSNEKRGHHPLVEKKEVIEKNKEVSGGVI